MPSNFARNSINTSDYLDPWIRIQKRIRIQIQPKRAGSTDPDPDPDPDPAHWLSDFERSQILQLYRRRLSVCAVKAQATCLLSRLSHFGDGARDAAKRRDISRLQEDLMRRDLRAHWEANVTQVYKIWILELIFPNILFGREFFFPKFALFWSKKVP